MSDDKLLGRFEMLWDCPFCSKTKLLGITHRHCPECGGPQDQTKRYFPSDEDKKAIQVDDYAGIDRACGSCNHPNGNKATFCAKCGAPLDAAAAVKKRSDQVVKAGHLFGADDATKAESELGANPKPKPIGVKKKSYKWVYGVLIAAAVIFSIWFMCIRKRTADFEVAGQSWKRTIAIEEYKDVEEEAWKGDVPSAGRTLRCRDKKFESKKIEDGKDCSVRRVDKGDGTFEEREECVPKYRYEDVNRPWCTYLITKWTVVETKTATGEGDSERTWPATGVKPSPLQSMGARREGARHEVFVVVLDEKGKKHTCEFVDEKEALWKKLTKGAKARGEVRARSGDIVCDTLRAK